MAIVFLREKRRQKYILIGLGIVIIVAFFVVLVEFFVRRSVYVYEMEETVKVEEINIDFEILERAKDMRTFEVISPLPRVERRGRANPFAPFDSAVPEIEEETD